MLRILVTLVSMALLTGSAAAADISIADIFTGAGDPQSNEFLNMIFGSGLFEVTDGVGGTDETLISTLMTNFNVIFFAVGVLLLVYNIVVAVTETAHDGSVFGARHSALWAPIRLCVAAAMLIPLPGGYNGLQHGVAYVTRAGTATASFFWSEAVDAVIDQNLPVAAPDFVSLDANFLQSLWRMELCMASYNQEVAKAGDLEQMTAGWAGGNSRVYAYSLSGHQGACGKIELPEATSGFERIAKEVGSDYDTWLSNMQDAVDGMIATIRPVAEEVATAASTREEMPASRPLADDMKAWRSAHKQAVAPFTGSIGATAEDSIEAAMTGDDGSDLANNLKANGWTRAGFYYQTIARYSSDATSILQMLPVMTPGDAIGATSNPMGSTFRAIRSQMGSWWPFSDTNQNVRDFLAEIGNTYALTVNWWNESVARSNLKAFTNERVVFADSGGDTTSYLPSMQSMNDAAQFLSPAADKDPMLGLVTFGNAMAAILATAITALTVLAAFPLVGGAVGFIGTVCGWLLNGMALAGMFLAWILPMLPTIIWVFGVLAFLLLIVEAIFAAPLWAMAHLSMDQEGLGGRQGRRGYVLLLSVFLTPMLMLFGLFIGMILFRVAGTLINGGFYYALTSSASLTGDSVMSMLWIFGVLIVMLFMAFVYLLIIERSFALIAEFPARVFRWFEDIGGDLDGSTSAKVHGAGLTAGSVGGGALVGGGRSAQGRIGARNSASQSHASSPQGLMDGYSHPKAISRYPPKS